MRRVMKRRSMMKRRTRRTRRMRKMKRKRRTRRERWRKMKMMVQRMGTKRQDERRELEYTWSHPPLATVRWCRRGD